MRLFFRNPEIRRSLRLWLLADAAAVGAGWLLDRRFGVWTAAVCLALTLLHFGSTCRRYRALSELSREIDRILHDSARFDLAQFQEGELAILHSEIYKMTVRLREQADALRRDKTYLADSIADISHQIRTPLTSLHLVASFLAEEDLEEARRLALVREFRELLGWIDWLIDALLKISRLDAGTVRMARRPVTAAQLIRRAAEPLAIPMDLRGQRLTVCAGGEQFVGDLDWSAEAVENILKNCMEHTPEGGEIRVSARQTPIFMELAITDSGPGIDPEDLPHLFERFYRGKDAGSGSVGIGLALARMILTAQNGTVKADRAKEGGAEFIVRFYSSTV